MAEYVSKAAVRQILGNRYGGFLLELDAMPAADVMPVVHGKWLKHYRSGVTIAEGYVSSCCDMWNKMESLYCPNCGAKMDEGVDVDNAPTVDAVEVVRCIKCKHLRADVINGPVCGHTYGLREIFRDSYCSYGEYRTHAGGGTDD